MNKTREAIEQMASTVVDASGYPYQPIVKELKVNGSKLGPRLAAQMICKIYNDHYEALGKRKRRYLYACDTAKIGACAGALNKLGKDLSELLKDDPADGPVRKALATTLFSAHETASYVGILIFLKELLFSFEGAADARALSALRASSAGLKARVEDAFHGPLGDSGSIPTSPLIWSPVNVHEFNNNVAIYSRLDASSGGDGGWLSMWYVFHGLTPVPHAAGLRSAFEHGLRPGR